MKRDLDFVTYELVGINPREYYAGRFAVAVGDTDLLATPSAGISTTTGLGFFAKICTVRMR